MAQTRKATAIWNGSGKEGKGKVTSTSGVLSDTPYSFKTRFENEDGKAGTNPEELIAAAHSGCFSMKLAFNLQAENLTADSIETEASVILEEGSVHTINLTTKVAAEGLTDEKLQELAKDAKENCPISKLMNATINLEATLG